LFGLQERVPKTSGGSWFQTWMVLFTKEYYIYWLPHPFSFTWAQLKLYKLAGTESPRDGFTHKRENVVFRLHFKRYFIPQCIRSLSVAEKGEFPAVVSLRNYKYTLLTLSEYMEKIKHIKRKMK
jgi:hypothetical protein